MTAANSGEISQSFFPPTVSTAKERSRGALLWLTSLTLLFVYTLSCWIPLRLGYPSYDLDASWLMALKWAHGHAMDFGRQFVFTFGPWGYVYQGYSPNTFAQTTAAWALFATAFFVAALQLARGTIKGRLATELWLFFLIALTGANVAVVVDARLFSLSWLLLCLHLKINARSARLAEILLVVAMALASQVKFSVNIMAILALAIVSVVDLSRRRIPWLLLIYCACYIGFWGLAGQRLGSLPVYLRHSVEIVGGYAQGEATSLPSETVDVLLFVSCGVALLLLVGRESSSLAAVAVSLFMAFKSGYVRHDQHEIGATVGLAAIAWIWAPHVARRLQFAGRGVVIASLCICWHSYAHLGERGLLYQMVKTVTGLPSLQSPASLSRSYQNYLATIRRGTPLPPIHSSVDIYPWGQSVLIANDLDDRPRPVIQSYLAYTPSLAALNATYLLGPDAPESILFDVSTIDGRYPSQDDALSWPQILRRYDLKDSSGRLLLLHRSWRAKSMQITPPQSRIGHFGEEILLPGSDKMIWIEIDISMTAWGRMAATLYKDTPIFMTVRTADGNNRRFRLIPEIARGGFLLSPEVIDRQSFAFLMTDNWARNLALKRVVSIVISPGANGRGSLCYDSQFAYQLSGLSIAGSARPNVSDMKALSSTFGSGQIYP